MQSEHFQSDTGGRLGEDMDLFDKKETSKSSGTHKKFRAGGGMWLLSNSLDVTAWKIVSPLQNAPSSCPF